MPQVYVTLRGGDVVSVEVQANRTLMEGIRDNGIGELLALCAGCCSCATCHVHVGSEFANWLPPMSADEEALLDGSAHRRPSSRLSCQIRMIDAFDGLKVTIAPEDE